MSVLLTHLLVIAGRMARYASADALVFFFIVVVLPLIW